ncbi:MAG TPA: TauD/TfdA family dioxygenase [Burkholderiales bacterium]|nr:TauD/TfdA family dioxygenase [Burkholderiales bacterium]
MDYRTLDVRPIAGALGAEIYGADLGDRDDSPVWNELRQAFLEYHVIAIRGQTLSPDDMMRVGGKFGDPCYYPFAQGIDGYPYITPVIKEPHDKHVFGEGWHTDTMYLDKPPRATLLYALETPPKGGDTLYVNTAAAYDALSDGMKRLLGCLVGVCSGGMKNRHAGGRAARFSGVSVAAQNIDKADAYESKHPIVRTHPETGRKSLYVSSLHTIRFDGFTEEESKPLIDWLDDHCTRPEFSCRVRWEPGQLTIWDNRITLHNAVNDYPGVRREMRRLTVGPERPV